MASLVDVAVTPGNLERVVSELNEAVTATAAGTQSPPKNETFEGNDSRVPAKLRGKSAEEIAEMYQNLESAHGRMANDLGQVRQLADRLLELKRNEDLGNNSGAPKKEPTPKVEISAAELLERPTEALDRHASSREAAMQAQVNERLQRVEAALVQREFAAKHPDANTVAQSPEFVEWVKQSPVRTRAAQAAVAGNFGAADDLLTEFKDTHKPNQRQESTVTDDNHRAARSASLESGGTASGSDGAGSKKSGKVYSRADLMRLRIEKPETYYDEGFQNEIMLAYHEGRVK